MTLATMSTHSAAPMSKLPVSTPTRTGPLEHGLPNP